MSYSEQYITQRVRDYSDMVLRLAFAYLRNRADAQDVCQDVFIRLFKQPRTFTDHEHEWSWIIRVTINRCKDMLRSPWKRKNILTREVDLPIRDSQGREVVAYVLELPAKYRLVIHLYYFEHYSTAEVAALLQLKEATVRTQLRRARELLRTAMGGTGNA
ncbi:hypothetical protein B9T62_10385 [Paenibacillus donghaensis]|uniref:RNA polymerase subunit sigma-24 n=2 Tax=Paenibacillus donghaensis TaxID=414771 RepID=A0A2Z2KZF5_9BACL|nr:hypothetical protein B9T62_10385 [Paenibacillus donghaensis]